MTTVFPEPPFAVASRRTQRRLALAEGCRLLAASGGWVFVPALLAVGGWRVSGHQGGERLLAPGLVAGWLVAAAVRSWIGRPPPFAALAAWDHATGRKEAFASAYAFETAGVPHTLGEQLHLARAQAALQNAARSITRDLPVSFPARMWLPPLLFLCVAFSGWLRQPLPKEEQALSAAARQRAVQTAGELKRQASVADPLKGLTKEERARAEALKAQLEQTAKKLERLRQETPRDVLAELEKRAREAEKLAGSLAGDELGGASSALISELERNADTAELGDALRGNNLGKAAEEARKLAQRLQRENLSLEERNRVQESLKRAMAAASSKDRQSALGQRLGQALNQLQAGQPGAAGQQFSSLAQQLATAGQRQNAQNQLRQLAGSLRAAGQQIMGGQTLTMQRLPQQSGAGGLQSVGSLPMPVGPPSLNPGGGQQGSMPQGGTSNPQPGPSGTTAGGGSFPMPGGNAPMPGGNAPMPGGGPGAMAGAFPVPGGAAGGSAGQGGSQAGVGTAAYSHTVTAPLGAAKTGVVNAQANAQGPSEVRAVNGEQHGEAAQRGAQQVATDFIKVEEQALNEEPLPLSRREQVLRYFTALRKQIDQPAAPAGAPR